MSDRPTYKLDELAHRAGVTPRTVRYYVQRGLLPAPAFRGRDTAYGDEHLLRLQVIRAMQGRYLPLDVIEARLARSTGPDDLRALLVGDEATGETGDEALSDERDEGHTGAGERGAAWRRWEIAPGLELHLRDSAGGEMATLARWLLKTAAHWRHERDRERGKR